MTQHVLDSHPITFHQLRIGPTTIYDRSPPINRPLLITGITLSTIGVHNFIGNTRIDFALGQVTPTTQLEFDALQRIFPATKGASLLFRGFWQPVRLQHSHWPLRTIINPQGRSIVVQIRSITASGPTVGISDVSIVVLTSDLP